MKRQPATVRIARWSATHAWRAILLWIVFVAVCSVAGGAVGSATASSRDMAVGESGRALATLHSAGLDNSAVENVLITPRSGGLDLTAARKVAAEATERMRALPEVAGVAEPVTAHDGTAVLLPITMRGDPDTAKSRVKQLQQQTAALQHAHPELRIEETGGASIPKGIADQIAKDLQQAESASMPVTLVIMLIAFGAIIAAGVPVLLAITAVVGAMGLTALSSHLLPATDTASSMVLMVGMAVGVDYSLFYLKREREERARGRSHLDAVEIAAATSGHSVVVSGIAVIVSMIGLYLTGDVLFTSLATCGIIVVAVAMLGSLTVLPALLAKLGNRVDRPRVPVLWRLTATRSGPPRLWPFLLRPALRFPKATLLASVGALLLLALPATDLHLKWTGPEELPRNITAMQTYDRMTAAFPGQHAPHELVVRAPADRAGEVSAALRQLVGRTANDRLFAKDRPPEFKTSADGRVHALILASAYGSNSPEGKQALRELRHDLVPATVGTVAGAEWALAGDTATNADWAAHLSDKLPLVVGFVLLLTFAMMAVAFRSIVLALTTIVMNLLSAVASFGLLALVFQHSWADTLLNFHSTGTIVAWIPLFLFAVLSGLSMDYHVFVVSRIREAAQRGLPTPDAVSDGLTRSAGVVTSAALVMVSVFALFASLSMAEMKQMGVGLCAAVLIDAIVVRAVILPSLMTLLGRANWWPSRLSRRTPSGSGAPAREAHPVATVPSS